MPVLQNFIDNSESLCNINKIRKSATTEITAFAEAFKEKLRSLDLDSKFNLSWVFQKYIPLGSISIGSLKYYTDKNTIGFLDFLSIFAKLEKSDDVSDYPNIVIKGVTFFTIITLSTILLTSYLVRLHNKNKKRIKVSSA